MSGPRTRSPRAAAPARLALALRSLALFVPALLAPAAARADELVRLLSPPQSATLEAGAAITLEWAPGADLAGFAGAEEWEVFLSLDGGRTYLARITPHLDLAIRRVTVRLPDLPSADARLLLRMGDERIEREQELPGRYRIVRSHARRAEEDPRAGIALPVWRASALRRGESARPAAPGVVHWVEGDRDGSGWTERRSAPGRSEIAPALSPGELGLLSAAAGPRELAPPARPTPLQRPASPAAAASIGVERARPSAVPFELLRRRNE